MACPLRIIEVPLEPKRYIHDNPIAKVKYQPKEEEGEEKSQQKISFIFHDSKIALNNRTCQKRHLGKGSNWHVLLLRAVLEPGFLSCFFFVEKSVTWVENVRQKIIHRKIELFDANHILM